MNSKGETNWLSGLIFVFVGVIVALALLNASANNVSQATTTLIVNNATITWPASGSSVTLTGQAVDSITATNSTTGAIIPSSNYTITNYNVSSTGAITTSLTATDSLHSGKSENVTYVYEPFGYDTSSGSRAIDGIIVLLAALAVAVWALPNLKDMWSNK